jgi:hypothetical protein
MMIIHSNKYASHARRMYSRMCCKKRETSFFETSHHKITVTVTVTVTVVAAASVDSPKQLLCCYSNSVYL